VTVRRLHALLLGWFARLRWVASGSTHHVVPLQSRVEAVCGDFRRHKHCDAVGARLQHTRAATAAATRGL
jgi:hypothetical protein